MVYCSVECRKNVYREAARKEVSPAICVACRGSYPKRYKNSTTCSRECWSLAYGRRAEKLPDATCALEGCDVTFTPKSSRQKCCSENHGAIHWNRNSRADGSQQNSPWNERRKAAHHKRRAQKRGTQVEDIRPIDIYERDIWLCGLCVTPVDPDCAWPDPMSPSLDHIIPLSKGGTHIHENVQLAHLTCNVSKGNRVAA